ncbi:hypothetical protein H072_3742 [Dactylellina haptotyla CBS 200.50]|uniref:Uncharacterized protein n=1 Tax=Dactylellina haptotyla (strain CBS 200.50) TaxID=1284197 RepID=S8BS30_DACHA|nr:hypothetical protein H072_3742 [Dactylellina haptotyla CBS 200.50]
MAPHVQSSSRRSDPRVLSRDRQCSLTATVGSEDRMDTTSSTCCNATSVNSSSNGSSPNRRAILSQKEISRQRELYEKQILDPFLDEVNQETTEISERARFLVIHNPQWFLPQNQTGTDGNDSPTTVGCSCHPDAPWVYSMTQRDFDLEREILLERLRFLKSKLKTIDFFFDEIKSQGRANYQNEELGDGEVQQCASMAQRERRENLGIHPDFIRPPRQTRRRTRVKRFFGCIIKQIFGFLACDPAREDVELELQLGVQEEEGE